MSMVPSLPSDTTPASEWRGPRVKGAVASNGSGGAAPRLTESLESPFATLLEAVGIGSEVGPARVADKEGAVSDEAEEALEEREGEVEKKGKKRAQDAATEAAGVLAAAGLQTSQRVTEPPPVEAGASTSDAAAESAPIVDGSSNGELANLEARRVEDNGLASPVGSLVEAEGGDARGGPMDGVSAGQGATQLTDVLTTSQSVATEVLQSRGASTEPSPLPQRSETEREGELAQVLQPLKDVGGPSVAEENALLLPRESTGVVTTADSLRNSGNTSDDRQVSLEQTDSSQMVPTESANGSAATDGGSADEDGRSFLEKNGSEASSGDSGEIPVEAPLTETPRPQVPASPPASSPFTGMMPGGGGAPSAPTTGGMARVGGQVLGVASSAGIVPGAAGGTAQLQDSGDASRAPEVDQLALHLLGLEGSSTSGARVAGSEGSLGIARDGAFDRSHLLRALGRIEKTLKGLAETKEAKTVSLRLDPPSLGSMTVDVSFRDGELHARLTPELPQVAAILRERSHELHAALRKIGLSVDQVRVSIDTGAGGAGAGDAGARHGSSRHDGGPRDFADQVAPVGESGLRHGDSSNGIGGAWRDGRWVA